ncbi:MAG: translation initiation factor IF-3 [Firmicutes bacterium]|nr:translation initiation factor IF-3 [Bacillota bacterium]
MATFKELQINNEIRATELRVIGAEGEQLGIMGFSQAMRLSDELGLDLVLISPKATPPVARIIDYGKFKFESIRKEKEQRKSSKQAKIKEIQLSLNIQENEIAFKMKSARGFIEDGNKVKVAINRIRGRATMNADKGVALLVKFAEDMGDIAEIDQAPTKGGTPGRNVSITMVLAPKKKK